MHAVLIPTSIERSRNVLSEYIHHMPENKPSPNGFSRFWLQVSVTVGTLGRKRHIAQKLKWMQYGDPHQLKVSKCTFRIYTPYTEEKTLLNGFSRFSSDNGESV